MFDFVELSWLDEMALEKADPENPIYAKILDKFFDGKRDKLTLQILSMTNRYQLSQN